MHSHTTRVRRAAAAGLAALALTSCATSEGGQQSGVGEFTGRGPIAFAAGKDPTGLVPKLVDEWNAEHPKEKVTFVELSDKSDQQRQTHIQNAQTRSDAHSVIAMDIVWTSEFAANRWIDQLPVEEFPVDKMLPSVVEGAKYWDGLYAVPQYSDGGMLYYRSDLLKRAGISKPPTTWAELKSQCAEVLRLPEADGMSCFAGQYEKYEGLTANLAEAVQSAGGVVTDEGGVPAVDTEQARAGLQFLVEGFKSGMIPRAAVTYQEEQGRQAFQKGKLLFHRQWPYQYALANAKDGSSKVAGKFEVAPLPGADGPGSSSLGGWNLAVSSFAKNKATALDFIKFMTSERVQRRNLVKNSMAPAYADLYEDPKLIKKFPYLPVLKESILGAKPRPKVVRYGDATAAIQNEGYAALTGEKSVEQALADLQQQLQKLTEGH